MKNPIDDLCTLDELWQFMKCNIRYGWTNKNHEFREYDDARKKQEYFLHSHEETLEDGCGICLDQVELEKQFCLKHQLPFITVSFNFKNSNGSYKNGGHTFLIAYEDDTWKYFERAFQPCANIVPFETLNEAVTTIIVYYISCVDTLDYEDIDNMNIYINPPYQVGMNTEQIFEIEANTKNSLDNYITMLKYKYRELNSDTKSPNR